MSTLTLWIAACNWFYHTNCFFVFSNTTYTQPISGTCTCLNVFSMVISNIVTELQNADLFTKCVTSWTCRLRAPAWTVLSSTWFKLPPNDILWKHNWSRYPGLDMQSYKTFSYLPSLDGCSIKRKQSIIHFIHTSKKCFISLAERPDSQIK